jgi:hypothetical protein
MDMSLEFLLSRESRRMGMQLLQTTGQVDLGPRSKSQIDEPRVGPPKGTDSRLHKRIPIRCWVALVYFDSHHVKRFLPGRALDMSGDGLSVETFAPLEKGSVVSVRSRKVSLISGTACIRHCGKRGFKYRMGLQYRVTFKNRF